MTVGTGMRELTGCTNDCFWTESRPPEAAAYPCSVSKIQSRAAPIPRTGSSCVDSVCRVPNDTSFSTVAFSLAGSTSVSSARSSASGTCAVGGGGSAGGLTSAWAGEVRAVPMSGVAAPADAAAMAADRKVRRPGPALVAVSILAFYACLPLFVHGAATSARPGSSRLEGQRAVGVSQGTAEPALHDSGRGVEVVGVLHPWIERRGVDDLRQYVVRAAVRDAVGVDGQRDRLPVGVGGVGVAPDL